jgi:hypothetical protein
MTRPRIYGDEKRFRANLAQHVQRARSLLDQADGVHTRVDKKIADLSEVYRDITVLMMGRDWREAVAKWRRNVGKFATDHLGDQVEDLLPALSAPWPHPSKHELTMDEIETWLREVIEDLVKLQDSLGVSRNVAAVSPPGAQFAELIASGLVDQKVVEALGRDLKDPRTPKQLADAIGTAKELTEATLRGALDRLGEPWSSKDDFPTLMKKWRRAIAAVAPPDPTAQEMLDRAQSSLGNLVNFLAEWRNAYGRGHGKTNFPPGLRPRHARLAADAAETAIRFIVTTMDDLALLSPSP